MTLNLGDVKMILRPACVNDAEMLRRRESSPHLSGLLGEDDWQWETTLATPSPAHRSMIAEVEGRPVGFLEILDLSQDPDRYWGDLPPGFRAIEMRIGEPELSGKGIGSAMMREALNFCFSDPDVHTVLVDPVASNTPAHRFYERCGFCFVERRQFGEDDCFVFQIQRTEQEVLD